VFFVLSFALYLGRIYEGKHRSVSGGELPTIAVPLSAMPSKGPTAVTVPVNAAPTPAPAAKP
jgi:hypothetical protein